MIKIKAFIPSIKEGNTEIGITADGESLAIKKYQVRVEEDNRTFNLSVSQQLKGYMEQFEKYYKKKKEFNKTYNAEFKKLDHAVPDKNYEQIRNLG